MTIQYQQNNINQDGDSKNIVTDGSVGAIDIFGRCCVGAFVDATAGPPVAISLPLAREAGRNAEITIIKVDNIVANTVLIATQSDPDGVFDTVVYPTGFLPNGGGPANVLAKQWQSQTLSSDGISTWTMTATTQSP